VKPIKAFIFDMDGTLIDTESIATVCWKKVLGFYKVPFIEEAIFSMKGAGRKKAKEVFDSFYHGRPDFISARHLRNQYVEAYIKENGVRTLLGAKTILSDIRKSEKPICLATSSKKEYSLSLLAQTGLIKNIDYFVFGDEVSNGKPNPEIFIKAALKTGFDPKECLIIEDSKYGIEAGYKAGFIIAGIPNAYSFDDKTKSMTDLTFNNLSELDLFLKREKELI